MKIRISEAAKELGVSIDTLRRWEAAGKIEVERTPNGHRRYDITKLRRLIPRKIMPEAQLTIGYARVSSHEQREDLVRQVVMLESFCSANGWKYNIIKDLESGLNYQKRGLKELICNICEGTVKRLVITHKDRLLRFGAELIFSLCEHFGTEVVIINASEDMSVEEELVKDVLEIITVFSARLYGSRSHKNKEVMERLREAAKEIAK